MHNLSEFNTFDPDVSVPDDAVDFRTAASLNSAHQSLTNRTRYLLAVLRGNIPDFDVVMSRNMVVMATAYLQGAVIAVGTATFNILNAGATALASLVVSGNAALNTLTTSGNTTLGNSLTDGLTVFATAEMRGPTATYDTLSTLGALNLTGGGTIAALPLKSSGLGRVTSRAVIGAQSGGGTLTVQARDWYFPTMTAAQNYTISDSNAVDDDEIYVCNDSSYILTLYAPGAVLLGLFSNNTGEVQAVRVKRIAGTWRIIQRHRVP